MGYLTLCLAVFAAAYTIIMLYTSVFYHRGLAHGAIRLRRWTRRFVIHTGNWVTGIDPKTWSCMHRMHHHYADTPQDPHAPKYAGFFRLILVQLWSYGKTLDGLAAGNRRYTSFVRDLNFPVHWLNRSGFWFVPHLLHTLIAVLAALLGWWELGLAYWLGIQSHPVQGWAVNSFGHALGYRNFNTPDESKNNLIVAWLVMGEGFQNNHHYRPREARFSVKWFEADPGYWLTKLSYFAGLVDFPKRKRFMKAPRRQKAA